MPDGSARQPVRGPSPADAIVPLAVLACLVAGALAIFKLDLRVAYGFTSVKIEHVEPAPEPPTVRPPA